MQQYDSTQVLQKLLRIGLHVCTCTCIFVIMTLRKENICLSVTRLCIFYDKLVLKGKM